MLGLERYAMLANQEMAGHGHDCLHICVILAGGFEEDLGRRTAVLEPGDMRLSAAGTGHHLASGSSGADCLIIELSGDFWNGVFGRGLAGSSEPSRFHSLETETLATLRSASDGPRSVLEAGSLIAGDLIGKPAAGQFWLDDLRAAFDAEPERPAVRKLALAFGRHRTHVARAFKQRFGLRPVEYRALRRAGRAVDLIADRSMPLAEVALASGYAHQSHMNGAFRNLLGLSPGDLRQRP